MSVDINKQSYKSVMSCESTKKAPKASKDAFYIKGHFVVASIYTVYSNSKFLNKQIV